MNRPEKAIKEDGLDFSDVSQYASLRLSQKDGDKKNDRFLYVSEKAIKEDGLDFSDVSQYASLRLSQKDDDKKKRSFFVQYVSVCITESKL